MISLSEKTSDPRRLLTHQIALLHDVQSLIRCELDQLALGHSSTVDEALMGTFTRANNLFVSPAEIELAITIASLRHINGFKPLLPNFNWLTEPDLNLLDMATQ